ncbi:MAG: DUF1801 domain-containing protein [Terriglobales bacterium]|jgi:hypothetical protein
MKHPDGVNKTIPGQEVAGLLAAYAPEVRNLALAARTFMLTMIPGIVEQVDARARIIGYGYGPKYADMVGVIMPTKAGVNLGIAYAMDLPDPQQLLEGTGKLHRHVKLRSKSDLDSAALKSLVRAAVEAALRRREKTGRKASK